LGPPEEAGTRRAARTGQRRHGWSGGRVPHQWAPQGWPHTEAISWQVGASVVGLSRGVNEIGVTRAGDGLGKAPRLGRYKRRSRGDDAGAANGIRGRNGARIYAVEKGVVQAEMASGAPRAGPDQEGVHNPALVFLRGVGSVGVCSVIQLPMCSSTTSMCWKVSRMESGISASPIISNADWKNTRTGFHSRQVSDYHAVLSILKDVSMRKMPNVENIILKQRKEEDSWSYN